MAAECYCGLHGAKKRDEALKLPRVGGKPVNHIANDLGVAADTSLMPRRPRRACRVGPVCAGGAHRRAEDDDDDDPHCSS